MNMNRYRGQRIHWNGTDWKVISPLQVDYSGPSQKYRLRVRPLGDPNGSTAVINFDTLRQVQDARDAYVRRQGNAA